jgi:hypothetical protein
MTHGLNQFALDRWCRSGRRVTDGRFSCQHRLLSGTRGLVAVGQGFKSTRNPRQNPPDSTRIPHKKAVHGSALSVARSNHQRTNKLLETEIISFLLAALCEHDFWPRFEGGAWRSRGSLGLGRVGGGILSFRRVDAF